MTSGRSGHEDTAEVTAELEGLGLSALSEDLVAKIFEFLDARQLHKSAAPVCQQW